MSASRNEMPGSAGTESSKTANAARGVRHVFVRNLVTLAHIGVHGHEQGKAQPVRINIDIAVDDAPLLEDRLDRVVDYEAITLKVRAVLDGRHFNLAETLAEQIASICLKDHRVHSVRVRVEKLHALPGAESGGVEIERRANQGEDLPPRINPGR